MTHYDLLGVSPAAPDSVIKAAYKARIRETHPDAGGDPAEAQSINDAWSVLGDADKRAAYDRELADTAPEPETFEPAEATVRSPAPAASRSPEPAEPVVYAGSYPAPKPWWRNHLAIAAAVIACAVSAAYLIVCGLSVETSAIAGLTVAAGIVLVAGRSTRATLVALGLIGAAVILSLASSNPYWVIAPVTAASLIVFTVRRREDRGWATYAGDVLLTTAAHNPGIRRYEVLESVPDDAGLVLTRLRHVSSGREMTTTLWDYYFPGTQLLIGKPDAGVVRSAPAAGVRRALKWREKEGLR